MILYDKYTLRKLGLRHRLTFKFFNETLLRHVTLLASAACSDFCLTFVQHLNHQLFLIATVCRAADNNRVSQPFT